MSVSVIFGRLCNHFTLYIAFSEQRKSTLVYGEQFSLNIEYVQTVCERMNDGANASLVWRTGGVIIAVFTRDTFT